jgi:phosphoglycolate phosphatase-like HAD superfamily hydrolase
MELIKVKKLHLSFDLDGTLINSIPLMKMSWENVNNILHLGIGWSKYKKNIGLPFDEICKNLNILELKEEVRKIYFAYNANNIDTIESMPGLSECLSWLQHSRTEWSIITSKPTSTALPILKKFSMFPNVLITSDDTRTGKPTLLPATRLLDLLGGEERNFYYVGDTLTDHLFSVNASFKFIEFKNDMDSENGLSLSSSNLIKNKRLIINTLSSIPDIFIALDNSK